jgi:hypothetical protein
MDITLSIATEHVSRVVDALCGHYDYVNTAQPGETKNAFAKRMTIRWLKEQTLAWEADEAADAAREAALAGEAVTIT